jgi:hypothetical protein
MRSPMQIAKSRSIRPMTERDDKAYIRALEDEKIAAYNAALAMIGDCTPQRLHSLLNLLECRDLMRDRRREEMQNSRI